MNAYRLQRGPVALRQLPVARRPNQRTAIDGGNRHAVVAVPVLSIPPCSSTPHPLGDCGPCARGMPPLRAGKGFGAVKPSSSTPAAKKELDPKSKCPCGSGTAYEGCCRPFHVGLKNAESPEQLLRSRYCAYFLKNAAYIADTTHPDAKEYTGTRSSYMASITKTQKRMDCRSLQVMHHEDGTQPQDKYITFKITFYDKQATEPELQSRTEKSRFVNLKSRWFFMDSEFIKE